MLLLEPSLPNLSSLELSSNHLAALAFDSSSSSYSSPFPKLIDLRLDFNAFESWDQLLPLASLTSYAFPHPLRSTLLFLFAHPSFRPIALSLKTLSLSHNSLPVLPPSISCFPPTLETLHLANNRIPNWESMDILAEKAPGLIGLTVRGNGVVDGEFENDDASFSSPRRS